MKNGKVYGAESMPFVLPRRWTFQTLSSCVADYVNRNNTGKELIIKQLYYKRAHAKGVVKLNSDCDISALLQEYPMRQPSGKRKRSTCMYLAVDLEEHQEPSQGKEQTRLSQ